MEFIYNRDKIRTTDDITISVADLRDLIQACTLQESDAEGEYQIILDSIAHKNHLDSGVFVAQAESTDNTLGQAPNPIPVGK
ncbi:hypothetical protein [Paraburkholderia eburnea]|uniref:hypothetical protein n=1 Tax=Paraburkholderia eburnea TaxID=1189126 RepID=UPI0011B06554|nr:hypothetical protein [Paraburkholderia eburnea]